MQLREILAIKGSAVHTITPQATLREAAGKLIEHRVGALLVLEDGHQGLASEIRGILSERDLLWACADPKASLEVLHVADAMSHPVITGTPEDRLEDVMGLMTNQRKRHLPVVGEGRLLGIVSIGDLVKAHHDQLALEHRFMKDYIRG